METIYVGLDMAKDTFDAYWPDQAHAALTNDETGWQKLQALLPPQAHCVLEYTGVYSLGLASFLHQQGVGVSVLNPLTLKHYGAMQLRRAKTDAADARLLSTYGQQMKPPLWQPQAAHSQQIRQLFALLNQFNKQYRSLDNFAQQQQRQVVKTDLVDEGLTTMLTQLQTQIDKLETELRRLVEQHHGDLFERLQTIPGIGPKTAMLLIGLTQGFACFNSAKQLIAYVGLAPRIHQSGKSIHRPARICKMGTARVRKALYLATWSAMRFNAPAKALFERLLTKGKAKRQALMAVANKLLKQAFAIAKSGGRFEKDYKPTKFSLPNA